MSIDSVFVHKMWDDHELSKMVKGGIPFPMLSDTGGKVGIVYGIYGENGVSMIYTNSNLMKFAKNIPKIVPVNADAPSENNISLKYNPLASPL